MSKKNLKLNIASTGSAARSCIAQVSVSEATDYLPTDMDFCYLANNFSSDLGGIPNSVTTSDMGQYNQVGTLTKNGEGSDCYLSNSSSMSNYLYQTITSDRLTAMKALSAPYTFYCRTYNTANTGGVISWRRASTTSYHYMLWNNGGNFVFHDSSGIVTIPLVDGDVIKVVVNGSSVTITDLDNGTTQTLTVSTRRDMTTRMQTFNPNYGASANEAYLDKFYGIAGIARETTAEEDENIKYALENQVTTETEYKIASFSKA